MNDEDAEQCRDTDLDENEAEEKDENVQWSQVSDSWLARAYMNPFLKKNPNFSPHSECIDLTDTPKKQCEDKNGKNHQEASEDETSEENQEDEDERGAEEKSKDDEQEEDHQSDKDEDERGAEEKSEEEEQEEDQQSDKDEHERCRGEE